jgi:hypothetical protein
MLAACCALLVALLAAPGAALTPGSCRALGKEGTRAHLEGGAALGWGNRRGRGRQGGRLEGERRGDSSSFPWLVWVSAGTG